MPSEQQTRDLARLVELAAVARKRLDGLSENVQAVRSVIDDIASSLEAARSDAGRDSAQNRTTDARAAQVEAASK